MDNKIIDFNKRKNDKKNPDIRLLINDDDIDITDYNIIKKDIIEMFESGKVVARNDLEARMISKILLESNPDIHYCLLSQGISRITTFIEIIPVMKEDLDVKLFTLPQSYHKSYLKYLEENNLIEFDDEYGMILFKD